MAKRRANGEGNIRPLSAMLAVTRMLHHMGRVFRDNSVPKSLPGGIRIDRKRLEKLREKRTGMGLRGNVQMEDYDYGQTM